MTVYLTAADYYPVELAQADEAVTKLAAKVKKLESQSADAHDAYEAAVDAAAALRRRGPDPDYVTPTESVSARA